MFVVDKFGLIPLRFRRKVRFGDYSACEIANVGTMRIMMFDGVVPILSEVRYVSKMRKNLLSLGFLESNGCGYLLRDGVMKVTDEGKEVWESISTGWEHYCRWSSRGIYSKMYV